MWLLTFCREHGISSRDRTHHELTTLVQALWLAGTYDGLNLGGNAALEAIARRMVTIVEAYRSGSTPGQASWESARYLTGVVDPFDVVSPELRSFANKAARDDAERHVALTRGRAAGTRQELDDTGAALTLGGLPGPKDEAKGGAKGAAAKAKAKAKAAAAAAAGGGHLGGAG